MTQNGELGAPCVTCGGTGEVTASADWSLGGGPGPRRCACRNKNVAVDLDALRDECAYIPSVDVCGHCGDCYCDGTACIVAIDVDKLNAGEQDHFDQMETLQARLREGRAWRVMHDCIRGGASLLDAYAIAAGALIDSGYGSPDLGASGREDPNE